MTLGKIKSNLKIANKMISDVYPNCKISHKITKSGEYIFFAKNITSGRRVSKCYKINH